jgi:Ca2+/H+ antiporter, TMEM165/GDT1 family
MVDLGVATGFVVVFAVVGGFELFDRTSFALIALATRAAPFPTWAGGALAFVASTAIAVTVGAGFATLLGSAHIGLLRVAGGVILIAYAAWLATQPPEEAVAEHGPASSALLLAFGTVFLLEMADTTMIFEIVFVTDWGWFVVLVAGAGALVSVAAWDVVLGRRIGMRLKPETLRRIVVTVLVAVGVVTILYGLAPGAFPAV